MKNAFFLFMMLSACTKYKTLGAKVTLPEASLNSTEKISTYPRFSEEEEKLLEQLKNELASYGKYPPEYGFPIAWPVGPTKGKLSAPLVENGLSRYPEDYKEIISRPINKAQYERLVRITSEGSVRESPFYSGNLFVYSLYYDPADQRYFIERIFIEEETNNLSPKPQVNYTDIYTNVPQRPMVISNEAMFSLIAKYAEVEAFISNRILISLDKKTNFAQRYYYLPEKDKYIVAFLDSIVSFDPTSLPFQTNNMILTFNPLPNNRDFFENEDKKGFHLTPMGFVPADSDYTFLSKEIQSYSQRERLVQVPISPKGVGSFFPLVKDNYKPYIYGRYGLYDPIEKNLYSVNYTPTNIDGLAIPKKEFLEPVFITNISPSQDIHYDFTSKKFYLAVYKQMIFYLNNGLLDKPLYFDITLGDAPPDYFFLEVNQSYAFENGMLSVPE